MMPQDKCSIAAYWNIFKIILKYEIWDPFDKTLGFNDPRVVLYQITVFLWRSEIQDSSRQSRFITY
jgi:hypothetical protein